MKRLYLAVFITCSVIAAGIGQACANATEPRVALVIGNAAYRNVAPLKNAVNDARDMAKTLQGLGFDVIRVEDANKQQLDRAIGEFSSKLGTAGVGLFYYSGHGMQENGRNYLIPVDANLATEAAVTLEATDLDLVLTTMAQTRVNLVILDACRNNPFERRFRAFGRGLAPVEWTPGGASAADATAPGTIAANDDGANGTHLRAPGRGLAAVETARGTFVAYATAPGTIAADGDGANGLYTAELLKAIAVPGLKVEDVFKAVRVAVSAASSDQQIPWESSSLTGDFFFKPAPTPAVSASAPGVSPDTADVAFWNSVKTDTSRAVFEEYLKEFPNGRFATLAKLKISELSALSPSAPTLSPTKQTPEPAQTALMVMRAPSARLGGAADEVVFHCPQPGTRIEYNTGSSMLFTGTKVFSCTYKKKNRENAETFGGLVDDARFADGLGKLWPLKVGGEQSFNVLGAVERFTVLRRESVEVEAGEFDTFVIEQEETVKGRSGKRTFWYAPDFGLVVQSKFVRLPTRQYGGDTWDGVTIPSGYYEAVRITSVAQRNTWGGVVSSGFGAVQSTSAAQQSRGIGDGNTCHSANRDCGP